MRVKNMMKKKKPNWILQRIRNNDIKSPDKQHIEKLENNNIKVKCSEVQLKSDRVSRALAYKNKWRYDCVGALHVEL